MLGTFSLLGGYFVIKHVELIRKDQALSNRTIFSDSSLTHANPKPRPNPIIIDSKMSFDDATTGIKLPSEILKKLCLVDVEYYGFDSLLHKGQIVVNKQNRDDLLRIFARLKSFKFPIKSVIPIARFNWSDSLSMINNNTSCFNYRTIKGSTKLSDHAEGKAIDINPFNNPYVYYRSHKSDPAGAIYDTSMPGTITAGSEVVSIFKSYGWKWGGDWKYSKDYQHFSRK